MQDPTGRRATFRKLHDQGCFLMPNPWDRGSAIYLEKLGFPALATTSAGFAFSQGLPDSPEALTLDRVLAHVRELVEATALPVNADFQSGYARDPEGVARNVRLCAATGVAGLSIEDASGDAARPLYELDLAVERIRAARAALDEARSDVLLTARAECFLVGHSQPLAESIRRLQAYSAAGADVLFAPGLPDAATMRAVIEAVAPKPVNVLIHRPLGLRVADVAALGARRISVGSALARAAWAGFMRAARELAEAGTFGGFDGLGTTRELSELFD